MQTITLYRYVREDGGVTISPIRPDCAYTELSRLIADEGMELVNGDAVACCVDTEDVSGWTEREMVVDDERSGYHEEMD